MDESNHLLGLTPSEIIDLGNIRGLFKNADEVVNNDKHSLFQFFSSVDSYMKKCQNLLIWHFCMVHYY